MVRALKEIWRVLTPNGILIDLRPIHLFWPVEVMTGDKVVVAGEIDSRPFKVNDDAADDALKQVEREGWFASESTGEFAYTSAWDTLAEMIAYGEENWSTFMPLPESLMSSVQALIMKGGANTRVRIQRDIGIRRYRKLIGYR